MNELFLMELVRFYGRQKQMAEMHMGNAQMIDTTDPLDQERKFRQEEVAKVYTCVAEDFLNLIGQYARTHNK